MNIQETKANCAQCTMSTPAQKKKSVHYDANLKCCTFYPFLPNFSVGALLLQNNHVVINKIQKREYSLPIGLVAPVRYQVEFNHRKKNEFGNKPEWLCPYYSTTKNECDIWVYRGSVCTTYYCKSSYNQAGISFWQELNNYLTYVEMALMEEILVHLDFSPRQISDLVGYLNRYEGTKQELSSWVLPLEKAKKLWNGYFNEQEEFFIKAHRWVSDLNKSYFREAIGYQGELLEEKLFKAYNKTQLK